MSGGSTVEHIDAVDAFARTLYLRAKQSGLAFADVAAAVRQLHLALRHLRVEAADQDSLLNNRAHGSSPACSRRLRPMVEDCEFTLDQLEAVMDRYGDGRPSGDEQARDDRLAVVRSRLVSDKTNVDMFLDTVQLHTPANKPYQVDGRQPDFEDIKDKVDTIANRLFHNRDYGSFNEDEDSLWLEFKAELEKEGFAPQVLRKHKDILRAYIRELESNMSGGTYPTVRGLLEREANSLPTSPKELPAYNTNEKFYPGMKDERRMPDLAPVSEHYSTSPQDTGSEHSDSLALISTRDLMAMDTLNSEMTAMSLQSPSQQHYSISPSANGQRYLPSNTAGSLAGPELSSSPNSYLLGASPRSVPPLPPYVNGGGPPAYGTSPLNAARLAPDRYGNEIPADAQWTRIRRTLVSPEVLERAGVRYEARPEYVAILGRLSKEQITEYARQSAEARAARSDRRPPPRRDDRRDRERADSKSSRDDDDDDESAVTDFSDTTDDEYEETYEKGTKSYPFIVNPPRKSKTSPPSTTLPKPILKNRNENHVRFDPEPHEVDSRASRSLKDDRDRDRRRDRSSRRSAREPSRRYSDSADQRERHRDRHGDWYGSSKRHHRSDRRGSRRDDRSSRKKVWGETLGAVGIGGAAVSLISVLAEAASAV
ncbi:hypothetical protein AK830_g11554 [Neonectria ditissima]|uniref:DUF8035 domain-containing protein n=1 Tax=Neonectria ditissima TaxID=78410 RepID=A0A0P7B7T4_9HYPO|nr:hypothetical protein AK830_g11554 [Neonectria ditissima]